jgi:hypothetical protein
VGILTMKWTNAPLVPRFYSQSGFETDSWIDFRSISNAGKSQIDHKSIRRICQIDLEIDFGRYFQCAS